MDNRGKGQPGELAEAWLMVEGLEDLGGAEACDWCGDEAAGGYFVAVGGERYEVCALCWGRSPEYVDLRREGREHEEARRRISGAVSG